MFCATTRLPGSQRISRHERSTHRVRPRLNLRTGPHRSARRARVPRSPPAQHPHRSWSDGTNRSRPGLREALASCRDGDTLVIAKLDRLARSLRDARTSSTNSPPRTSSSTSAARPRPRRPVGRLLFNVLAMVAEFESDLIRARTREGMQIANAKGHLAAGNPNSAPQNNVTSSRCTKLARTRSRNWLSCSPSDERPSTAALTDKPPQPLTISSALEVRLPRAERHLRPEPSRASSALFRAQAFAGRPAGGAGCS